jgi:hypothetical protein
MAIAIDSVALSEWWKASKDGLKADLADAEYRIAFDAALTKIKALKAIENNPQAERDAA